MSYDATTPVGRIVSDRLDRLEVLEKFGIDYCCGGEKPLDEACRETGHALQEVLAALSAADRAAATVPAADRTDWQKASLSALTEHITETHHTYMKQELPRLGNLMTKVLAAHGSNHSELAAVCEIFAALKVELTEHLLKEENVLFPLIRNMEATNRITDFHCGSVQAPINAMEREHDNAGEALRSLRRLTSDYTPPSDACPTYVALLDGLEKMERDLHIHIHKENNILHPRTMRLESQLASSCASARKGSE